MALPPLARGEYLLALESEAYAYLRNNQGTAPPSVKLEVHLCPLRHP